MGRCSGVKLAIPAVVVFVADIVILYVPCSDLRQASGLPGSCKRLRNISVWPPSNPRNPDQRKPPSKRRLTTDNSRYATSTNGRDGSNRPFWDGMYYTIVQATVPHPRGSDGAQSPKTRTQRPPSAGISEPRPPSTPPSSGFTLSLCLSMRRCPAPYRISGFGLSV